MKFFRLLALLVVLLTAGWWVLPRFRAAPPVDVLAKLEQAQHEDHDHADHADHGGHAAGSVIALSARGLKNIGFESLVVEPIDYQRQLRLPAIVVERPGRSQLEIASPLTGIVTKIHAVTGEAVEPEQLLFEVRLTHEELVAAQREYLRTVENLEVVERELNRLRGLAEGVVAGRRVLEKEYEKQKFEASLHAESQAMLLHGLTPDQVAEIRATRTLFQTIEIRVPSQHHQEGPCGQAHPFQIQQLTVTPGQQITAGTPLAVLGDHCQLLIEALAFEDDASPLREAAQHPVTARPLSRSSTLPVLKNLEILYVADQIDPESRAFKVYLLLPNRLALDKRGANGKRFIEWVYKPGQRLQLEVPVETWQDQLVLPTTAVVSEGAETYVYRQHGDHFDQVAVHVLHRDQDVVVVANDGALARGVQIAGQGAYQIHLALKNQAGGGIDPHAGHNH